jgi:hypothetical protein
MILGLKAYSAAMLHNSLNVQVIFSKPSIWNLLDQGAANNIAFISMIGASTDK